jgi:hypothetical protein
MLFGYVMPFAFAAFSSAATGNLCAAMLKYSATDCVRAQARPKSLLARTAGAT